MSFKGRGDEGVIDEVAVEAGGQVGVEAGGDGVGKMAFVTLSETGVFKGGVGGGGGGRRSVGEATKGAEGGVVDIEVLEVVHKSEVSGAGEWLAADGLYLSCK